MIDQLTPTQRRMMDVLSDGQPHRREELHACLVDELGPHANIHPHLTDIRKVIGLQGLQIVAVLRHKAVHYQLVRTVSSPMPGGPI